MRHTILAIAGLLSIVAATGCQSSGGTRWTSMERLPVGENLVDESCWAENGTMAYESVDVAQQVFYVYCGDWEWPSARVFRVESGPTGLDAWLANDTWRNALDRRMRCAATRRTTVLDGADAVLLDCKLNKGGWPYTALVTHIDGATFLADSVPAALPVVERTIAAAGLSDAGRREQASAAVRYLQDQLAERMYGAADLQAYYRAIDLGQYYNSIKSFASAEREYRDALEIHQRVLGLDNADTADALMHIALELSNQEQFGRADAFFDNARGKLDRTSDPAGFARFLSYYALHKINQGDFDVALQHARVAKAIRETLTPSDPFGMALAHRWLDDGVLSLEMKTIPPAELAHSHYVEAEALVMKNPEESAKLLEEGESILSSSADAPPTLAPQINLLEGAAEESRGDIIEARAERLVAASQFAARIPGERPAALADLELARQYLNDGQVDLALDSFRKATGFARRHNANFRLSQLEPYFDTLLGLADTRPADAPELYRETFAAAQLVQSGVTAIDIARTVARFAERDDEVGRLFRDLQDLELVRLKNRQAYEAELGRSALVGHLERLQQLSMELDASEREIAELGLQVQAISPRYRQLIASAVDADEVQSALLPGEALLHVLVGNARSYVFFVDHDRVSAHAADIGSDELAAAVNGLRTTVAKGRGIVVAPDSAPPRLSVHAAYELHEQLLGPLDSEMEPVTHLITVASGPLLSLPFGLLVTEQPLSPIDRELDHSRVSWLASKTAISLAPSAQSFVYLRTRAIPSRAPKSFVAFGDFVAGQTVADGRGATDQELCDARTTDPRSFFPGLPGTEREIEAVARSFDAAATDLYMRESFSEGKVKSADLADYRIVYFATHALLPNEVECRTEPSLITSADPSGEAEDGFLTSGEILELQLNADLVVLSACNTGAADKAAGESLTGLARAFFFAGARALLVTHWSVDDEATADLMTRMFESIRTGSAQTMSEALRQAQVGIIREPRRSSWSHPYFWAAFTLVGDGAQTVAGI